MLPLNVAAALFVFGLAIGSFFNVVARRYDGEHFVFDSKEIGGRSRCPHCRTNLQWFELVPLLSFLVQGGRCRHCKKSISVAYPIVELLTGLLFVGVVWRVAVFYDAGAWTFLWISALWVAAFSILFLISYIDIRLGIVPDELAVLFGIFVIGIAAFSAAAGVAPISLIGPFWTSWGFQFSAWANAFIGAVVGLAIFGGLWLGTRGRGMGMGDVKLSAPLGFLFGWPGAIFVAMAAFIIGAVFGIAAIVAHRKTMKSAIPFGPFLALGAAVIFFAGVPLMAWYFGLMGVGM
jgi:prepilin signal peptidase PulO-like enzyme (type II secretory pathway)